MRTYPDYSVFPRDGSAKEGVTYRLSGVLVETSGALTLILDDGMSLPILDDMLLDRLLATAPVFVGGAHLYHGPAEIVGILASGGSSATVGRVDHGQHQCDVTWYAF